MEKSLAVDSKTSAEQNSRDENTLSGFASSSSFSLNDGGLMMAIVGETCSVLNQCGSCRKIVGLTRFKCKWCD